MPACHHDVVPSRILFEKAAQGVIPIILIIGEMARRMRKRVVPVVGKRGQRSGGLFGKALPGGLRALYHTCRHFSGITMRLGISLTCCWVILSAGLAVAETATAPADGAVLLAIPETGAQAKSREMIRGVFKED